MRTLSMSKLLFNDKDLLTNPSLIAKWKKTGYEKLCCLRCIQTRVRAPPLIADIDRTLLTTSKDMNYQGSTCICRVPKAQVHSGTVVECVHCGPLFLS